MRRMKLADALPYALLIVLMTGGCAKSVDNQAAANNSAAEPSVEAIEEPDAVRENGNETAGLPTDDWIGRWTGPEGLFLDIQPSPDGKPGHYAITNRDNLDRQGDYMGLAEGMSIRFVRDGKDFAIQPGKGADTGFKYLAGKDDCLIVVQGQEGYCR